MKETHCNVCSGAGGEQQKCGSCNGQGFFIKSFGTGFMTQQVKSACPTCGGRGYTLVHKCYGWDGRGTKQSAAYLRFMIPKGVDSGQYLKIERAGDFKNGDVLFDKKPWGNSYKMPPPEPDAVVYASHFYASHHIPSYNRPGNNHINTDKYKKYTSANGNNNYNFSCHTTDII
jgi:DnaJ-class molecular chaperone